MKKALLLAIVTLILVSLSASVMGQEKVCAIYFYGQGCEHCARTGPFIDALQAKYADALEIHKLEIYDNLDNYKLYNKFCVLKDIPIENRGIPLLAVGGQFIMGEDQIKSGAEAKVQGAIESSVRTCPLPDSGICSSNFTSTNSTDPINPGYIGISLPLVMTAALIDSINPCAIGVLVFLVGFLFLVTEGNKKRIIQVGAAYIIGVYVSYLLMGIGLYAVMGLLSSAIHIIIQVCGIILIIMGLINIKDFFWYGQGLTLKIPESQKGLIKKYVSKASIPTALVLGFIVSAVELPCTGGVYLGIIAMLAGSTVMGSALGYLIIYNFFFVLPLIVIMLLMLFGIKEEKIKDRVEKHKNKMKLMLGILMVILGIILLVV